MQRILLLGLILPIQTLHIADANVQYSGTKACCLLVHHLHTSVLSNATTVHAAAVTDQRPSAVDDVNERILNIARQAEPAIVWARADRGEHK